MHLEASSSVAPQYPGVGAHASTLGMHTSQTSGQSESLRQVWAQLVDASSRDVPQMEGVSGGGGVIGWGHSLPLLVILPILEDLDLADLEPWLT